MTIHGLLLAAGAGRRMGRPKALVDDWLGRAVEALREGGCGQVTVVLGAEAERARELVPAHATVVVADDWAEGMGTSLRVGLAAMSESEDLDAVVVSLVDLPDVGADVVRRVLATSAGSASLSRATYAGRPGHPVLLGRDHWVGVMQVAVADHGARDYLAAHAAVAVECGDLASGADVDSPPTSDQREAE